MKKIVRESLVATEPQRTAPQREVKPAEPITKPGTRPRPKSPPSPIRRERPSVIPRPKASADDVAEKYLDLIKEE